MTESEAAFEKWFDKAYLKYVSSEGLTRWVSAKDAAWDAWQAALEWKGKGEPLNLIAIGEKISGDAYAEIDAQKQEIDKLKAFIKDICDDSGLSWPDMVRSYFDETTSPDSELTDGSGVR